MEKYEKEMKYKESLKENIYDLPHTNTHTKEILLLVISERVVRIPKWNN